MSERRKVYFPEKPTKPPLGLAPAPPPSDFIGVEVGQYKALLRVARTAKAVNTLLIYDDGADIWTVIDRDDECHKLDSALKEVEHLLG